MRSGASAVATRRSNHSIAGFKRDKSVYEVYQDLNTKLAQDKRHWCVSAHGRHLVLAKDSLYIFRQDAPLLHDIRYLAVWVSLEAFRPPSHLDDRR
eukprot:CAMPEP_0117601318 /NCGR_PEP_ID=MMETSP0784-20121206/76964_1 /TAXON_ID=39447 /ORGANISM="" /LENGTH=95 /DNA_ID=CAMNT_0005404023 /DNA_START=105 /DNA_END=392 /DNA_ORIENTATION=-